MTQAQQHIRFERMTLAHKKTNDIKVKNNRTKGTVGWIRWYGGWRKYVFFPEDNHFFDWHCLRMIADRCEEETRSHMAQVRERKAVLS